MSVHAIRPNVLGAVMNDRPAFDPTARGYSVHYRRGRVNYCPGCGKVSWWVGRHTAECAFCATTLPLDHAG